MNPVFSDFTYSVFDLETTGLDPEAGHKPIEVGAVRLEEGRAVEEFESFVDPGRSIPEEVTGLTGIRDEDVAGADPPAAVLDRFLDFVGDDVLVAHNIDFDLSFLRVHPSRPVENDTIDTLRMARKLLSVTSHSLDSLVTKYDLDRGTGHRATADARATAQLFEHLTEKVSGYGDYVQCGIPERIRRNDLGLVLGTVEATQDLDPLGNEIKTVRKLRDRDNEEIAGIIGCSAAEVPALRDQIDRVVSDYSTELKPQVSLINCYKVRYWSGVNWFLNGLGLAFATSSLFTNRSGSFSVLVWLGVALALLSPPVTYFRRSRSARIKQWTAGVLVLSVWLALGYYLGVFPSPLLDPATHP